MSQLLSNAHIECIINGHRFEGLAEEDRPYEFVKADNPMVDYKVGADGGVYGKNMASFGGKFLLRLAPTSPSVQWAIQEKEYWKQALENGLATRDYNGTFSDPVQGRSARLEGGFLLEDPDMLEPGITFELMFYFERIAGNVDGAVFNPTLATP